MMEELCIVCDLDDNIVGSDTKKNVHLIDGISMKSGGLPHRAFSVFLFNEKYELLLQKRSSEKILFPLHWANTCCSHPLAAGATFLGNTINGEEKGSPGTVQAARRKLEQELGIDPESIPTDAFHFVTKVHYKAPLPGPNPKWGEHEIDYILLAQVSQDTIESSLKPNPGEVCDIQWISQSADPHKEYDSGSGEWISPWFSAIEGSLLHNWWDKMKAGESVEPDGKIHRLKGV
eukprot:GSMAST32.ASY1.ANO1.1378.1 assembled CDS